MSIDKLNIFTYLISTNFISLEAVPCLVEFHMKSDMAEWIDRRYDILWEAFGDKTFRFEDAAKLLIEKNKDAGSRYPFSSLNCEKQVFFRPNLMQEMHGRKFTVCIAVKPRSLKNLGAATLMPCLSELPI